MYFVNASIILSFSLIGGSLQPCLPRPQPFRNSRWKVWLPEAVWSYKGPCVYKCLWVTRISHHFTSFSFARLSLVTWTRSLTLTTTLYQRYYHSSSLLSSILSKDRRPGWIWTSSFPSLSSSGWIFQQASQTHWHWSSGSGWCFHPDAIPFWEPWGTRPKQENFWDHLLWCPHGVLWAGQTWWAIRYIRGITSQQGGMCTGNYLTDLYLGSFFSLLPSSSIILFLPHPFSPLSSSRFPSPFHSWFHTTHYFRSCNTICGEWLPLISGIGANSKQILPSEYKW